MEKEFVANSQTNFKHLRDCIEEEGTKLNPDVSFLKTLKWKLEDAYREEEKCWKERSKENWLKHGDQNTKSFHSSVHKRRVQNKILSLFDEMGVEKKDRKVRLRYNIFRISLHLLAQLTPHTCLMEYCRE